MCKCSSDDAIDKYYDDKAQEKRRAYNTLLEYKKLPLDQQDPDVLAWLENEYETAAYVGD